jgi:hypothetical protein
MGNGIQPCPTWAEKGIRSKTFRHEKAIQIIKASREIQIHYSRHDETGVAVENLMHRFSVMFERARILFGTQEIREPGELITRM